MNSPVIRIARRPAVPAEPRLRVAAALRISDVDRMALRRVALRCRADGDDGGADAIERVLGGEG